MILYRIRNVDTKLFFLTFDWYKGKPVWTDDGAFYKKIDTIKNHLTNIVSFHKRKSQYGRTRDRWVKLATFKEDLKNYEVIVTNVTVNKSKKISASDLFKDEQPTTHIRSRYE